MCQRYFTLLKSLNSGIGEDRLEFIALASHESTPKLLKNAVIFCGTDNIFKDFCMDIADCIVNIDSCLRDESSNINVFIYKLISRYESWSVNTVLIKEVNRILEYLCSKHDFSFVNQSNGWTLPNGDIDVSLFFRDFLHLIEVGNVKFSKLIIDSVALTNDIYFSSNTGKMYSYSGTCKNKVPVSFALTLNETYFPHFSPLVHADKGKRSTSSNNCNRASYETHGSNYVSSTSKPVSTKTVCKPVCIVSCNKSVIFSPVYKSLCASNVSINKTVCYSISCKPVSALISSEPVKFFATCKSVCFSNVRIAKNFNSVNYCCVTCTEHPVNFISSAVRNSTVSYANAYPNDFDIIVQTVNVTLLHTYRCVSFNIQHRITLTLISIFEIPLHLTRSPAALSICSSLSSAS